MSKLRSRPTTRAPIPASSWSRKLLRPRSAFTPRSGTFPAPSNGLSADCRGTWRRRTAAGQERRQDKQRHPFQDPDRDVRAERGPARSLQLPPTTLADAGSRFDGGEVDNSRSALWKRHATGRRRGTTSFRRAYTFPTTSLKRCGAKPVIAARGAVIAASRRGRNKYRINYYNSCAPTTAAWARPTGTTIRCQGGFYAHIGDWMRVTAIVSFNKSGTENLTTLQAVEYEVHGEVTTKTAAPGHSPTRS